MSRRTNAQLDADKLREAADLLEQYGVPGNGMAAHTPVLIRVIADSIEAGSRTKRMKE